jgi:hypothetical protein
MLAVIRPALLSDHMLALVPAIPTEAQQQRADSMTAKEKKTAQELSTLIMQEMRKHAGWDDIVAVAIIYPSSMNWDLAFSMSGQRVAPEPAWTIARELQARYDVSQ